MDFDYSAEDEAFRRELRTWLEANAPREPMQSLAGGFEQDEDDWKRKLSWYRKLAAAVGPASTGQPSSTGGASAFSGR